MSKRKIKLMLFGLLAVVAMNSCVSVAAYQKAYLNDAEMALQAKKLEVYETNFQAYREGAAGANGGKSGGGCGCN
ncbi:MULTISPECIES: DUF4266 domain-containing protein [Marinifilum]|jgi:hypothetical protein|uniref:DUF4266 domain-containing protein n=1 Tax=Marinifilum TaxID=866673 RepID=UPI0006CF8E16|nr:MULTISPECIES: DUF4266 domain-containing protein [Marinifilum]MCY1634973.1 DUF4266 domain-containing protein [Marinifilum sp. D737]MDQ2178602.1 DUF4266 domain-containing protein [Marinifilum sp. D714]